MVEVDGATHGTDAEVAHDNAGTIELRRLGYCVFRVHDSEIYGNMERVLDGLLAFIEEEHR